MATYYNSNAGAILYLSSSNSQTPGVLGAIGSNEILAEINAKGDDGVTGFIAGTQIISRTSGTISSGVVPAQIEFYTANTSGVITLGMTLTNAQVLTLANALTVANGGSGRTSSTAYALIAGGTTSTGVQQSLTAGTSGQFLTSGGSSALPTWTTATFPASSGTAGTILRSNGTNWVNSTSTFADTYSASTILYSNGANTVTGLATGNNGTLITSGAGVPSISSTLPAAVQGNITALGTIAQNVSLTANGSSARFITLSTNSAGTGSLALQAGSGSSSFGASLFLFSNSNATFPGWYMAGISNGSGGKFAVNSSALADGTNVFTVDVSGNTVANGSISVGTKLIVTKVNGTEAANALTASGGAGVITTSSLTTAAGASYAITWTNTLITSTSGCNFTITGGTNSNLSVNFTFVPGSGSATLTIYNTAAVAALNGTILIGYQLY
jgi:hypothetical protein